MTAAEVLDTGTLRVKVDTLTTVVTTAIDGNPVAVSPTSVSFPCEVSRLPRKDSGELEALESKAPAKTSVDCELSAFDCTELATEDRRVAVVSVDGDVETSTVVEAAVWERLAGESASLVAETTDARGAPEDVGSTDDWASLLVPTVEVEEISLADSRISVGSDGEAAVPLDVVLWMPSAVVDTFSGSEETDAFGLSDSDFAVLLPCPDSVGETCAAVGSARTVFDADVCANVVLSKDDVTKSETVEVGKVDDDVFSTTGEEWA